MMGGKGGWMLVSGERGRYQLKKSFFGEFFRNFFQYFIKSINFRNSRSYFDSF